MKTYSPLPLLGLGAAAGLLGGLLGIGGGTIIVPMLILILGLPQKKAQGTSLMCAAIIALVAMVPYTIHGNINYIYSLFIIAGAVCGSSVGSMLVKRIKTVFLKWCFVCVLVYVAGSMVYSGITGRGLFAAGALTQTGLMLYIRLLGIGLVTGILSGLLGIGGGLVMVPCMLLLGLGQKTAQGISLLCMIPTAVTGVVMQSRWGNIDFRAGSLVGSAAAIFSFVGANAVVFIDPKPLRIGFGCFMLVVACMMAGTAGKANKK